MGYFHIYTGDGKGKTTAAFGLAFRALGREKHVFVGQFMKHEATGEALALSRFPGAEHALFGAKRRVGDPLTETDIDAASEGMAVSRLVLESGRYDLVVLDELVLACARGLADLDEVIDLAASRSSGCELVMTGRYAPKRLMDAADLVTEMRCLAHYARTGVTARMGVEL